MSRATEFLKARGLLNEAGTKDIEAKHEGITELPEGAWGDWGVEKLVSHFIALAKKKGKPAMSNSINNIIRWNKNTNKELSSKAREVMDKLMASKVWENI
jgi:hypothetical protein